VPRRVIWKVVHVISNLALTLPGLASLKVNSSVQIVIEKWKGVEDEKWGLSLDYDLWIRSGVENVMQVRDGGALIPRGRLRHFNLHFTSNTQ